MRAFLDWTVEEEAPAVELHHNHIEDVGMSCPHRLLTVSLLLAPGGYILHFIPPNPQGGMDRPGLVGKHYYRYRICDTV